jgi:hypothetical protein
MSIQKCIIYPNGNVFIWSAAANDVWDDVCHGRKLLFSLPPPPLTGLSVKSALEKQTFNI